MKKKQMKKIYWIDSLWNFFNILLNHIQKLKRIELLYFHNLLIHFIREYLNQSNSSFDIILFFE